MEALHASIAERLASRPPAGTPLLVGIDGAGGAGKSTFAAHLVARLEVLGVEAPTVHVNDFCRPAVERERPRCDEADVIAMPALLTTTMPSMKTTVDALVEARQRDKVKVLIGGAPVTQACADQIGAGGHAPDASSAARRAKALLGVQ